MNDTHPKLTARIKLLVLVTASLIGAFAVIKLTMTKAGFELDSKVHFSRRSLDPYRGGEVNKELPSKIRKRLIAEGFELQKNNRFVGRYKHSPPIFVSLELGSYESRSGSWYCQAQIEHRWEVPMGTREYHDSIRQLFEEFDQLAQGWVSECREEPN